MQKRLGLREPIVEMLSNDPRVRSLFAPAAVAS
jgi:hypothetical protein